jgi:hypothetical protein
VEVIARLFEQLGQPLPAIGRLQRDVCPALGVAEQLQEGLTVVDDPTRHRQLTLLVDNGDV